MQETLMSMGRIRCSRFPSLAWAATCVLLGKVWKTPITVPRDLHGQLPQQAVPSRLHVCGWQQRLLGAEVGIFCAFPGRTQSPICPGEDFPRYSGLQFGDCCSSACTRHIVIPLFVITSVSFSPSGICNHIIISNQEFIHGKSCASPSSGSVNHPLAYFLCLPIFQQHLASKKGGVFPLRVCYSESRALTGLGISCDLPLQEQ